MLIWNNIARRRMQSALTITITMVTVLVFVLVLGVFQVMYHGISLSKERLGADALILPKSVSVNGQELLFSAVPENVYMPEQVLEEISRLEGVEAVSPQFYSQTMDANCCDLGMETRVVGFEQETDFILAPYFSQKDFSALEDDQIILGGNFSDFMGEKFFVHAYGFEVVGQLYPTGSGMDGTIFMSIAAARKITAESEALQHLWQDRDPEQSISVVMVKLQPGYDPELFSQQVDNTGLDVKCILTGSTISSLQKQLDITVTALFALWLALLLVAALALIGRFSAMAKERKKEIGLLRAIGLRKQQVFGLIVGEACTMALAGGLAGSALALLCMEPVLSVLCEAFALSPAVWSSELAGICAAAGIFLACLLGFVSALLPAVKSASMDPQTAIVQGELG